MVVRRWGSARGRAYAIRLRKPTQDTLSRQLVLPTPMLAGSGRLRTSRDYAYEVKWDAGRRPRASMSYVPPPAFFGTSAYVAVTVQVPPNVRPGPLGIGCPGSPPAAGLKTSGTLVASSSAKVKRI